MRSLRFAYDADYLLLFGFRCVRRRCRSRIDVIVRNLCLSKYLYMDECARVVSLVFGGILWPAGFSWTQTNENTDLHDTCVMERTDPLFWVSVCAFFFGLFYALLRNVKINWNKTKNGLSTIMLSHMCSSKINLVQICHWILGSSGSQFTVCVVRVCDRFGLKCENFNCAKTTLWHRCLTNWCRNSNRRLIFEILHPTMISASIQWPFHKMAGHWYPLRITMHSMCTIAIGAPKRMWFICVNTAAVSLISSTMAPKIFWSVPRNVITSFDRSTSKQRATAHIMWGTEILWLRCACIEPAAFSYPPAWIKRSACGTHDRHAVSRWPQSMVHRCVHGIQVEFCLALALIRIKFNCSIYVD